MGALVSGVDISEELISIAMTENPDTEFKVASAEKLPYQDDQFDVVLASLSLHYLKDLTAAFSEVYRILNKDGFFVFSIQHPFNESTEIEACGDKKLRVQLPYFNNEPYTLTMLDGNMDFTLYHHTLQNISSSLSMSGFYITNIVEPTPVPESKSVNEETYIRACNYPTFIIFKAEKLK